MAEHAEKPPRDHPRSEHIPAGNHLPQEASDKDNRIKIYSVVSWRIPWTGPAQGVYGGKRPVGWLAPILGAASLETKSYVGWRLKGQGVARQMLSRKRTEEQTRAEVVSPLVSSSEAHGSLGSGTCVLLSSVSAYVYSFFFF